MGRRQRRIDLSALPPDVSDDILDRCVTSRIAALSKEGVRQLVALAQVSRAFRTRILALAEGWGRFVRNDGYLDPGMRQDWRSLSHVVLRRCVHCRRLCYQNVSDDTFHTLLHRDCLMGLTETAWFFDHRMLHRARVRDRLGPLLCAVVDYHRLTPEKLRAQLPHASLTGNHPRMGRYTFHRFCVEPNDLLPRALTLFGWLGLTPDKLDTIRLWYAHKHAGWREQVPKFPAIHKRMARAAAGRSRKRQRSTP